MKHAGMTVIQQEKLPKCNIIFRSPVRGTKRQLGTCKKMTHNYLDIITYTIYVYTTQAEYTEDEKGKYIGKDGKKLRRLALGIPRSVKDIAKTLAHEIAHLKYFSHTPQHYSYTEKIFSLLQQELKFCGIDISGGKEQYMEVKD